MKIKAFLLHLFHLVWNAFSNTFHLIEFSFQIQTMAVGKIGMIAMKIYLMMIICPICSMDLSIQTCGTSSSTEKEKKYFPIDRNYFSHCTELYLMVCKCQMHRNQYSKMLDDFCFKFIMLIIRSNTLFLL